MALLSKDTFAGRLAKALKGKDQSEIARKSGLSLERIVNLLAGEDPTMHEIYVIAEAAGVKAKPLTDAAMDDIAAVSAAERKVEPARPVTSSPSAPRNKW